MPERTIKTRFYHYSQNNSGGSFVINDRVAHHVIVEAESPEDADRRAEDIGIYFDGCRAGRDCPCCGDRWYTQFDSNGTDEPLVYGGSPSEIDDIFTPKGEPLCHVYDIDGGKTTYVQKAGR